MINSIYNVVQEVLNKNGYGLLTPARFVHFAEGAQLRVLDESIDNYRRAKLDNARNDSPDTLDLLEAIVEQFATHETLSRLHDGSVQKYHKLPDDYMRWAVASVNGEEITKIKAAQRAAFERSYFLSPTEQTPVCYIEGSNLFVLPDSIGVIKDGGSLHSYDEVELNYYRYPKKPNWTYTMVGNKPVFNPGSPMFQDFEVPYSLFNKLVYNILLMAGLHLREGDIIEVANAQDQLDYQKKNR